MAQATEPTRTTGKGVPDETELLSIIIPVYNEEHHVAEVIRRVRDVPLPKEIIVVDDGSTDRTIDELEREREAAGDLVIVHQAMVNMGKGTAVRIGLKYARGDVVLIQDSDLEYDPADYPALVEPIRRGEADVVYGNRFHRRIPGMRLKYRLANSILAGVASLLYGQRIRDEATAYKVFRRDVILGLDLHASRFELCPEVTAKVRRAGHRIHHVPIRYEPRTVEQGKKVRLRDAFQAIWTLLWYRFVS
ncbi:MAG TPA: glycosyltransferase family 2 protein [Candidatus Limnocylindrales bacterium]|nr:glycosyltransferase family 2 protein [Candidatus Limnocylindrales bacterium]